VIRPDRVRALTRIFAGRLTRQLGAVATTVVVLSGLDIVKHGVRPSSLITWLIAGAIMMPPMQGIVVVRDKMDGTLRFLASLPVAGAEHVAARLAGGALFAIPALILAPIGLRANAPQFSMAQDIMIGIGLWMALVAGSLALVALQLRTTVGEGVRAAMFLFIGLIILGRIVSSVSASERFAGMRASLRSPIGFAALSLLLWVVVAAITWWACRTVARISESYQGEPAAAG
jgi:hypothetical protein